MPYSFTQIEKDRSIAITTVFAFLCIIYLGAIWIISLLIKNFEWYHSYWSGQEVVAFEHFSWFGMSLILTCAIMFATAHWLATVTNLMDRLIRILKAHDPDLTDHRQKIYANVIEEVRAATGGGKIRAMIIPSMALNACAFSDGDSTPVIAVTKGLLYKLNRTQLEGVVAHEAAHVVSGDCTHVTVISSMFELFSAVLRGVRQLFDSLIIVAGPNDTFRSGHTGWGGRYRYDDEDDSRIGLGSNALRMGSIFIFILLILFIIWLVNGLASLMRMFISRQREYRADATATRLTRYPLGLAEALHIISSRRHSLSDSGDSLRSLFIINPRRSVWDNSDGYFSNLLSTHPPVKKRISVLLDMARGSMEDLHKALLDTQQQEQLTILERQKQYDLDNAPQGLYLAQNKKGSWVGPMDLKTITSFDWVTPQTIIKETGKGNIFPLIQLPFYQKIISEQEDHLKQDLLSTCPSCSGFLKTEKYERLSVLKCTQCHGILVNEDQIGMIFQRREIKFNDRIRQMAMTIINEPPTKPTPYLDFQQSERPGRCEKCREKSKKWRRGYFNHFYHIEVDKCLACGKTWFDKDELEILQCIYEMRQAQQTKGEQK